MIDYTIENDLQMVLGPGEKLLWTGRPRSGIVLRPSDAFLIPFSLLWGGFALFWESAVIGSGGPFFFKLWGIPFILVGFYITIGRFLFDAKRRAGTIYGLTKDRIIIRSGIFSKDVKSLNIKTISDITFNQKSDNTGTITLGSANAGFSGTGGMEWPGASQVPKLEFIDDVKFVYDKIIDIQKQN